MSINGKFFQGRAKHKIEIINPATEDVGDAFCQAKHVHWDIEGQLKEYWFPYGIK